MSYSTWSSTRNSAFRISPTSRPNPTAPRRAAVLLSHGQEYHTSYWGHLGLLGLNDHFLLPGYAAYANTAAASLYPTNAAIADLAHAQSALVGYVHPYDDPPDPAHDATLTSELPVDVALGKVDYYEVVGFSDHQASATVWHRLLNCGFRPSAAAGTDAMANYASMHGPVGLDRVYVEDGAGGVAAATAADRHTRLGRWLQALKAGHSMATNSALLGLEVDGKAPGSELELPSNGATVHLQRLHALDRPHGPSAGPAAGQGVARNSAQGRPPQRRSRPTDHRHGAGLVAAACLERACRARTSSTSIPTPRPTRYS